MIGNKTEISIQDFSFDEALAFFRLHEEMYDEDAVTSLIHRYGNHRGEEYRIPAIVCAALKNTAIMKDGYANVREIVHSSTEASLDALMRIQLELLESDRNHGEMFADILRVSAFLNGTEIEKDFLFSLAGQYRSEKGLVTLRERFDSCLSFFNSKLVLMNYINAEESVLQLHNDVMLVGDKAALSKLMELI